VDCRRAFAPCIAGVLTFANLATGIKGFDLELVEYAFDAEERGSGGNLGVVGRGLSGLSSNAVFPIQESFKEREPSRH